MTRFVTIATARLLTLPSEFTPAIGAKEVNAEIIDALLSGNEDKAKSIQNGLISKIDITGIKTFWRANILEQMHEAATQGADLLILPELCDTPFFANLCLTDSKAISAFCKQNPQEGITSIIDFAQQEKMAFAYNYAKEEGGRFYNATAVFQNGELIGEVYKQHLPGDDVPKMPLRNQYEQMIFFKGQRYRIFDLQTRSGILYRMGMAVCQERRHTEIFSYFNAQNVDVVAIPYCVGTAAFEREGMFIGEHHGVKAHAQLMGGLAQLYQMHIVACAKPGTSFGIPLMAGSGIWNPAGSTLVEISSNHGGSPLIAKCDLDQRQEMISSIGL